jgi:hypothetical protein
LATWKFFKNSKLELLYLYITGQVTSANPEWGENTDKCGNGVHKRINFSEQVARCSGFWDEMNRGGAN